MLVLPAGAQDMVPPAASAPASAPAAEPPGCTALTARAIAADLRAATAQSLGKDLDSQAQLLDEALALWRTTTQRCEGRAKERAERHLADNQKQRAAIAERQAAGQQCELSHRDAASLQEMARQAFGERRWQEAGSLYRKAETMWDLAAEHCTGKQQATAQQRRQQSETDGHNAEFCAPPFERAREHSQKFRNSAAGLAAADKQQLSLQAETLWRLAMAQCKGNALELAQNNAQALARERGTPWVATQPPDTAAAATKPAAAAPTAKGTVAPTTPAAAPVPAAAAPASPGLLAGLGSALGKLSSAAQAPAAAPIEPPAAARQIDIRAGDTRYQGLFVREEGQVVSGNGRVEWTNGDAYVGDLLRGQRHGQGELIWASGQRYQGQWVADKATGRGQMRFANGDKFEGSLVNGVPEGEGRMDYASGDSYQGQISASVPHGRGSYRWANGQVYEGDWVRDKPHGRGTLSFANGNRYEGDLADGQPHGQGRMRFAGGDDYQGGFERGASHGQGVYVWASGDKYTGQWRNGAKHGQGVFSWTNGDRWEGEFNNDEQTDKGTLKRKD